MNTARVNGEPYALPEDLPSLDEAMRIIGADLENDTIHVRLRGKRDEFVHGRMWQEAPWGETFGEIEAVAPTMPDVLRCLAAIVRGSRIEVADGLGGA